MNKAATPNLRVDNYARDLNTTPPLLKGPKVIDQPIRDRFRDIPFD